MTENSHLAAEPSLNKTTENKLRDTEIRLAILIGNLRNVVLFETGGGKEFVTQNIFNLLGYPPEKFTENRDFFKELIFPEDAKMIDSLIEDWHKNGYEETLKLEFRCKKADGEYVWLEDYVNFINPPGNKPYMTGVLIDITERKESENIIKQSLIEKEILLREIHHRVNNNLQVISSLLKIQSVHAEEDVNKEIFKETLNRIRSMAVIHQLTSKSNNLAKIDLNTYLIELSKHLKESFNNNDVHFKINSDENIVINIDIAVPCGLLINELIALILNNTENYSGKKIISCSLKKNFETEDIILTIHGKTGAAKGVDPLLEETLGLQLINTLKEQIDGKLEKDYSDGMCFTVTFKDNQYLQRLN